MPFADGFDRPDSTTLGASWVEIEFNVADLRILSNKLVNFPAVVGSRGIAYWNVPVEERQFSQLTLTTVGETELVPSAPLGPGVRLQSDSTVSDFKGYAATATASYLYLVRLSGAAGVVLKSSSHTRAAGDVLRLLASGSVLRVFANGVERVLHSDSTYPQGYVGAVGVGPVGIAPSFEWDNFLAGGFMEEFPGTAFTISPSSFSSGGGLREFLSVPIPIIVGIEAWHREHIRIQSLWSGSSGAFQRPQQAESRWNEAVVVEERDRFVLSPRTHTVRSDVNLT